MGWKGIGVLLLGVAACSRLNPAFSDSAGGDETGAGDGIDPTTTGPPMMSSSAGVTSNDDEGTTVAGSDTEYGTEESSGGWTTTGSIDNPFVGAPCDEDGPGAPIHCWSFDEAEGDAVPDLAGDLELALVSYVPIGGSPWPAAADCTDGACTSAAQPIELGDAWTVEFWLFGEFGDELKAFDVPIAGIQAGDLLVGITASNSPVGQHWGFEEPTGTADSLNGPLDAWVCFYIAYEDGELRLETRGANAPPLETPPKPFASNLETDGAGSTLWLDDGAGFSWHIDGARVYDYVRPMVCEASGFGGDG